MGQSAPERRRGWSSNAAQPPVSRTRIPKSLGPSRTSAARAADRSLATRDRHYQRDGSILESHVQPAQSRGWQCADPLWGKRMSHLANVITSNRILNALDCDDLDFMVPA